jgi:hypothetical protein
MKKFKLIKQYPGSVELGAIRNDCGDPILQKYFTKHPEFWEEVVEKDYEILISRVVTKEILSVKRLSDGEVFTVGYLINIIGNRCVRITGFENPKGNEYFINISNGAFASLSTIEKVKNPIFLTHDGKDIFDGDKLWYVNKQDHYKSYFIASKNQSFFSDRMAYFLTRQEAEDYIEKNKVLFTTEDGVNIKEGDMYYFVDTDFSIHTTKAHSGAGQYSEIKYFSTVEEAHEYVMQNVKALSIKDFWEITCMSTSNFNKSAYMRDLVKKTLGIK